MDPLFWGVFWPFLGYFRVFWGFSRIRGDKFFTVSPGFRTVYFFWGFQGLYFKSPSELLKFSLFTAKKNVPHLRFPGESPTFLPGKPFETPSPSFTRCRQGWAQLHMVTRNEEVWRGTEPGLGVLEGPAPFPFRPCTKKIPPSYDILQILKHSNSVLRFSRAICIVSV